jgi:hypothetical protein
MQWRPPDMDFVAEAERCRARAKRCSRMLPIAPDQVLRDMYLTLAQSWQTAAESYDDLRKLTNKTTG